MDPLEKAINYMDNSRLIKIGYGIAPFYYEAITVERLRNNDVHPSAPIVRISVDSRSYDIHLTRADVRRLIDWLNNGQI